MTARVRFLPVSGEGFRQARIAYNAAEYSRALEMVEAISPVTPLVLALRAKILRRLNRTEEAIGAVRAAISLSEQEEDRRSALTVLASIQATTGALDSASATLALISGPAADWSVETSSEVGFWQAWIAYCRGNLDLAEEQIVKAYADSRPFYHARAVQLQAFIFGARGAYQEQCDLLIRALREMREAPQEEIEIGMRAQVLYSLSGIAHDISNEIDPSELRAELHAIPWTPYLNEQRYWSYRAIGLRMAQEGGLGVSIGLGLLRRSAEYASTPSRRALSTLDSSDVAFSVNEPHNGRSLLDDADEIASTVDWSKERGDHRFALLRAAMLFARQERVDRARHYLTIYRNLPPMEAMTAFSHDDRLEGMRAHAEGITARMTGDKNEAVDFLSHAFSIFTRSHYDWYAAQCALEIYEITHVEKWRDIAIDRVRAYPHSWLAARIKGKGLSVDPRYAALTPTERRVFELLCANCTPSDIAERLACAPSTASKHVTRIYRKWDVRTYRDLLAAVHRVR